MNVLFLLLFLSGLLRTSTQSCKVQPGDEGWPDAAAWDELNSTVSGRLVKPFALGAACRPDDPSYNQDVCAYIAARWSNTTWQAAIPWTSDYNDDTCSPNATSSCSADGYPAYVIEAVNTAHVQAGVDFARNHNIRLVIKGTGHDYPGRSSGRGSLSIWTHLLQGIEIVPNDPQAIQYGGIASVKINAGMQWRQVYAEVSRNNITVVGGAEPNVGVGGWTLNGGHSPISSVYGLGADQVLEFEVVTADGQYLTVNETSHPNLFWAMRGGGSSFAVMLSVTFKAYPRMPAAIYTYAYAAKSASETYWSLAAYLHSRYPAISDAGGMGYHYLVPSISAGTDTQGNDIVYGVWIFPNKSAQEAQAIISPIESTFNNATWSEDPVYVAISNYTNTEDVMSFFSLTSSEAAGNDGRLGSWLMHRPALTSNFTLLKDTLKAAMPLPWIIVSHVVAGAGVRNAVTTVAGGSNAVNPAWRNAYAHVVLPRAWPAQNISIKNLVTTDLRNNSVPLLKGLAPSSGAYVNEADPSNPSWKDDYFGEHYPRLLEIKHKYDPQGVFWCKPCVGYDEWEIIDGPSSEDPLEWGIGQGKGRLCRRNGWRKFAQEV